MGMYDRLNKVEHDVKKLQSSIDTLRSGIRHELNNVLLETIAKSQKTTVSPHQAPPPYQACGDSLAEETKVPRVNFDARLAAGDIIVYKTGRKLKLCVQPIMDGKKTVFFVNVKTGTIYRHKFNPGYFPSDYVCMFNKVVWTLRELHEHFDLKFKDIRTIEEKQLI